MKKTVILAVPAVAVATVAAVLIVRGARAAEIERVRAAYLEYDTSFRAADFAKVRSRAAGALAAALPDEEAFVKTAKARPALSRIRSCDVSGGRATLRLRGTKGGSGASGEASLVSSSEIWRVEREDWKILEDPPLPTTAMPAEVQSLVERIASGDAGDASKAWNELGARYQSSASYLSDVRPALWDKRPLHFEMVQDTMTGGGHTFVYFSPKPGTAKAVPVRVETVGESLRYFLWQYEDVSNSGFTGSFDEWWDGWAPKFGLPGAVP